MSGSRRNIRHQLNFCIKFQNRETHSASNGSKWEGLPCNLQSPLGWLLYYEPLVVWSARRSPISDRPSSSQCNNASNERCRIVISPWDASVESRIAMRHIFMWEFAQGASFVWKYVHRKWDNCDRAPSVFQKKVKYFGFNFLNPSIYFLTVSRGKQKWRVPAMIRLVERCSLRDCQWFRLKRGSRAWCCSHAKSE